MTRRALPAHLIGIAAVVALSATTVGCGSSGGDNGDSGGLGGAIEVAAGAPAAASVAGCDLDRSTLEDAVEVYVALNGVPPTDEQDLLDEQLIREASTNYDVDADGVIVAQPDGPCS